MAATNQLEGAAAVTGAASGIGEGIARSAAALGLDLLIGDVAEERLGAVAESIAAGGTKVVTRTVDVSDPAAVEAFAAAAFAEFDRVRVVVNNAGIEATGRIWETSPETFERVVRVNLLGTFNGLRAFVPRLLEQGSEASIVNLSSMAALMSGPSLQAAYNASKHGVQALTETLFLELAEVGAPISVHVVNPGPVATRIFSGSAVEGAVAEAAHEEFVALTTERGMTGLEAGEIVLDGVARGEFWISTHPEWHDAAAARRQQVIGERAVPALPDYPG
jgi:NAD(P)-dependent dehydrogenase (short-subunit alcohol dehydrogenase family)